MPRIELSDLERKKLADAGRGSAFKHRSAQEIEIAELKNALAMARQKKTLRDEFAMAALIGQFDSDGGLMYGQDDTVKRAYEIADAMMRERMK